jgi:methylase of polypeptide subunit release factors
LRPEPHLTAPDAATLAGLRSALAQVGYSDDAVNEALGPRPPFARTRREVYLRRLLDAGPISALVRLFRLGEPIDDEEAAAVLAPADVDALVDAGLLERRADTVVSNVELSSYAGLLLAHDRVAEASAPESWHVLFGSASKTLAALTIRQRAGSALDLGTGCGVQALLAARHADRVVATDVSTRALTFARINAAVNELENVEFAQGDLFEPVAGERFDLIVSNPPFVVSPDSELVFRDSNLPGHEISRVVVEQAQKHLHDGGQATVLCSWIAPTEAHWSTPLRDWVDTGSDALLLQFTSVTPLEYAGTWTDELDRWLGYYREEGIERISTGAVILRRRASGGKVVAYQANAAPRENAGEQFVRILDAAPADDDALLAGRFRLVDHGLRQDAVYRDGAYAVGLTGVEIQGSPLNVRVEPDAIHVLPRLDGKATLAEAIDRAARETGLDRARIERAALTTVRRLYERGFLSPESRP